MGALFDGYELARKKREAMVDERHRKEEDVEHHLHALCELLNHDRGFMDEHGITCDVAQRVLHVRLNRSPVVTVHYQPEEGAFAVTQMSTGSQVTPGTVEDTGRAIGEMMFDLITRK